MTEPAAPTVKPAPSRALVTTPQAQVPARPKPVRLAAAALGAVAVGALAIGTLAIGTLAIGRLTVGGARLKRIEIGDLIVRRLTVIEVVDRG